MHPDLANLLAALRAQPEDDVAFLALADWCQEQPDEATRARGEHVRLSLELSKFARPTGGRDYEVRLAEWKGLREQVKSLERRHRVAWLGAMRDVAHRCDFLPGGLLKVGLTGGRAREACQGSVSPATREGAAWVSTIDARGLGADDLLWLSVALPAGLVRSFTLHASAPGGLLHALAARCPWLEGLRELGAHAYYPDRMPVDVSALAGHAGLAHLEVLSLSHLGLRVRDCAALAGSPHLRGLRSLSLSRCRLREGHLRALKAFGGLATLALDHNEITGPAVRSLADWPGLSGVRRLVLSDNWIGDEGAAALALMPQLAELRELSLATCGLTDEGLTALASAPFDKLESLDVNCNARVGDAGLMAVCEAASLPSLRRFSCAPVGGSPRRLRQRTLDALGRRFGSSFVV